MSMRKYVLILLSIAVVLLSVDDTCFGLTSRWATSTTGTALGSVANVPSSGLVDGDQIKVTTPTGHCTYRYDTTSTCTPSGSDCAATCVKPADNSGAGRWIQIPESVYTDGSDCPSGQYARGVDGSGNATGCTTDDDVPDDDSEVPDDITINTSKDITTTGAISVNPSAFRADGASNKVGVGTLAPSLSMSAAVRHRI
jgi:hypothetical protein